MRCVRRSTESVSEVPILTSPDTLFVLDRHEDHFRSNKNGG